MENNFNIKKELFYDVKVYDNPGNIDGYIEFFISKNNFIALGNDKCLCFWENDGSDFLNKKQFNEISRVLKKMMKIEKKSKILKELGNEK